jgi:hypothetical protein
MKTPVKNPDFPKIMLPFAVASLLLALFSLFVSGFDFHPVSAKVPLLGEAGSRMGGWPEPISAAEYEAHAQFQANFSFLSLGSGFAEPGYFHYDMEQDGLIAGSSAGTGGRFAAEAALNGSLPDIPPFPLEGFMTFLKNRNYMEAGGGTFSLVNFFPALCALVICIPAFVGPVRRGGGRRKFSLYNDKRMAA